jgi:hypothetical protein
MIVNKEVRAIIGWPSDLDSFFPDPSKPGFFDLAEKNIEGIWGDYTALRNSSAPSFGNFAFLLTKSIKWLDKDELVFIWLYLCYTKPSRWLWRFVSPRVNKNWRPRIVKAYMRKADRAMSRLGSDIHFGQNARLWQLINKDWKILMNVILDCWAIWADEQVSYLFNLSRDIKAKIVGRPGLNRAIPFILHMTNNNEWRVDLFKVLKTTEKLRRLLEKDGVLGLGDLQQRLHLTARESRAVTKLAELEGWATMKKFDQSSPTWIIFIKQGRGGRPWRGVRPGNLIKACGNQK